MDIWDGRSVRGAREFAEYLLLIINPMDVRHKDIEGYKLVIGSFAGIPAPMPAAKMAAPKEIRERAINEFRTLLRALTDQWIDSGKRNGIEQPFERNFSYVSSSYPKTLEATLVEFWKRNPPIVLIHENKQIISTQGLIGESDWA